MSDWETEENAGMNNENTLPATLDQNNDGIITTEEAVDAGLPASIDENNNGIVEPEEIEKSWRSGQNFLKAFDVPATTKGNNLSEIPNSDIDVEMSSSDPVGNLDSATAEQAIGSMGTNPENRGVEAHFGGSIPLIPLSLTKQPGLDLNTGTTEDTFDNPTNKGITWDDTKNAIQKLGNKDSNIVGTTTLGGIQTDDFNPEVENPSYSTGEALEPPPTDKAETSPALAKIGSATRMFSDIMSGKLKFDMPSTPNKVGAQKGSTLSKMAKQKSGSAGSAKQTPMKFGIAKNSITQGKENIYERIIDKVSKNYQHWPTNKDGVHYKEKGVVAVYVRGDWISVKYGSYRKTLLDTFAQEHPQFLPQILEVVNS